MTGSVTLTYDPASSTTVVDDTADARGPVRCAEPDGMMGVCSAGSMYAWIGRDVRIRRVRAVVAGVRP